MGCTPHREKCSRRLPGTVSPVSPHSLASVAARASQAKAPSPLRSAGALHKRAELARFWGAVHECRSGRTRKFGSRNVSPKTKRAAPPKPLSSHPHSSSCLISFSYASSKPSFASFRYGVFTPYPVRDRSRAFSLAGPPEKMWEGTERLAGAVAATGKRGCHLASRGHNTPRSVGGRVSLQTPGERERFVGIG